MGNDGSKVTYQFANGPLAPSFDSDLAPWLGEDAENEYLMARGHDETHDGWTFWSVIYTRPAGSNGPLKIHVWKTSGPYQITPTDSKTTMNALISQLQSLHVWDHLKERNPRHGISETQRK